MFFSFKLTKHRIPGNWRIKKVEGPLLAKRKKVYFKKRKGIFRSCLLVFFIVFIFLFLLSAIGTVGLFAWIGKGLPNPDRVIAREVPESTKIYDRTGKIVLYEIHGEEKRTVLRFEEIPDEVKWATIAMEDKDFYRHAGFDLRGIMRAFWVNLTQGGRLQGGSTITQQFIKNSILTQEKTYIRKIKELILAYQIERKFTKDQILRMYLNEVPYGATAYGIEAAAQTYFGKSARDIDLTESALLVALTKAPTYYSPYGSHREELLARQRHILDLMEQAQFITPQEVQEAKKIDVLSKVISRREKIFAPHFVMYVKELLTQKYGERVVEEGGLKVYTTLDTSYQEVAEEVIRYFGEKNAENFKASNAALAAIDPRTGEILAMVGSRDWFNEEIDGMVNVTLRERQPGSSFKPVVYAASFLKGYTPETILYDVVTNFGLKAPGKGDYIPHDYDDKERGPVSIRKALAGSLNIPAVKTLYLTGLDNVLELAKNLGYTALKDKSHYGLSLVLGGGEVKLLEHTASFGVFAQEGIRHPISAIIRIEDRNGRVIEKLKIREEKVLEPEIARKITDILSDNEARSFIFGAQNFLNLGTRSVAAKTGTTDDFRDAWTIGYTPSLVAGVWVGNNDNTEMKKGADGSRVAAPIWHEFMKRVLKDAPREEFEKPEPAEENLKPVLKGEVGGKIILKIDKASGKRATEFTPAEFVEERTYEERHSILHYLNKDDPRGPPLENPKTDPQYQLWEEAIQKWAEKNERPIEAPPQDFDDVHIPENKPIITISLPKEGSVISSLELEVKGEAKAPRGIYETHFFIDNGLMASIKASTSKILGMEVRSDFPFERKIFLGGVGNGLHTLKIVSSDDVANVGSSEITFELATEEPLSQILWLFPHDKLEIIQKDFPLILNIFLSYPKNVEKISFYYSQDVEDETPNFIDSITRPRLNNLTVSWRKAPEIGRYRLYCVIINKENSISYETKSVSVEVK